MREIVVVSGKGGTGKTSLIASFAVLAGEPLVVGDCDVDAANLALLLPGTREREEAFYGGRRARIDEAKCIMCAECSTACRFRAIEFGKRVPPFVDELSCEGCGACALVCPEDAIDFTPRRSGTVYLSRTDVGPLVHAALGIAEDNSGKLVARVRELARATAEENDSMLVLLDGPPGIGCPVHASLSGVDKVVAVTEPTPSGLHDLERLLELCRHFKLQTKVIINKYDLDLALANRIETATHEYGAEPIGRIPFDERVPQALANGETPLMVLPVGKSLAESWSKIIES